MNDEQQEQETPVWHAIVGDGWEPVQLGDETKADDSVLFAMGWVAQPDGGGFVYSDGMRPRRRRKKPYDVLAMKDGVTYCRINAAQPGECFRLTEHGELIKIEVEK